MVANENVMAAPMHSFFAKFLILGVSLKSAIPFLHLGAKCELGSAPNASSPKLSETFQ